MQFIDFKKVVCKLQKRSLYLEILLYYYDYKFIKNKFMNIGYDPQKWKIFGEFENLKELQKCSF